MTQANYLVRLDDACPTCDRGRWQRLEALFDKYAIRPIVAIVPDNQDKELRRSTFDPGFWDWARTWKKKGWTIGLHGYQHSLRPTVASQYIPVHRRSEFAGLPFDRQAKKISLGWRLLCGKGLAPTIWVAPAHSFDRVTLKALRERSSIRVVSDGLARNVYLQDGFHWLPQQLWRFEPKRDGLWTVCIHPNGLDESGFGALGKAIARYRDQIVSVDQVKYRDCAKTVPDKIETTRFWARHHVGQVRTSLGKVRRRLLA